MDRWLLKIELDGEWEECLFNTRSEAFSVFLMLVNDYTTHIRKAVILSPEKVGHWWLGVPLPASGMIQ